MKALLLIGLLLTASVGLELPWSLGSGAPLSNGSAVFGNPAGLSSVTGQRTSLGLRLVDNRSFHSLRLAHQGEHWGAGYRYSDELSRSELILTNGYSIAKNLSGGISLTYTSDEFRNSVSGDLGFQASLTSALRIGYMTRGLLRSSSAGSGFQSAAAGIRPLAFSPWLGNKLTLGWQADAAGFSFSAWDTSVQSLFADIYPFRWLKVTGSVDITGPDGWATGVMIQLSPNELFGVYRITPDKDADPVSEYVIQSHRKAKTGFLAVPGNLVTLDLNRKIVEGRVDPGWFFKKSEAGHLDVLQRIAQIRSMKGLEAVVIDMTSLSCSRAVAADIRRGIASLSENGIRTVVYMENVNRLNYFTASAADKIVVTPSSYFHVNGYAAEVGMYKGLMDKVGVEAQFVRRGDYKSFPESFSREHMSEEWKSNMENLLNSLWDNYIDAVSSGRGISADSLRALFDRPDISLKTAQSAGLIDTTLYEDALNEYACGGPARIVLDRQEGLMSESWSQGPDVALIDISGAITLDRSREEGFLRSGSSGSRSVCAVLRRARLDRAVRAVIIRINSPGGSAVASDIIWKEMDLLRESGKPVIVSIGSTGASGGYYAAAGGDVIIADPDAIVGSIGVFGGKLILKGLYEKLGVNKDIITTSAHADEGSDYRHWDSVEVGAVQEYMDSFYDRFIKVVAKNRHLSPDSVETLAQGQVYTGTQAAKNGLIDKIGGWTDAVDEVKERLGLDPDDKIRLVSFEPSESGMFFTPYSRVSILGEVREEVLSLLDDFQVSGVWAFSPEAFVLGD